MREKKIKDEIVDRNLISLRPEVAERRFSILVASTELRVAADAINGGCKASVYRERREKVREMES